jgi:hypothetical protein
MKNIQLKGIKKPSNQAKVKLGIALISAALLSACGSSTDDDETHTGTHVETEGRLAVFDVDAQALKVIDLDDGSIVDSFVLDGASTPRLYALPGQRYIAAIQRDDNLVSFVDSGLYTEDHGDHLHDYEEDPSLLNFMLTNVKPTHFEAGENRAIIFNDGSDESVSSVSIFSAASIADGETLFELNRESNMHGAAKLIDDNLFVTHRDASITDTTLPAEVERYSVNEDQATFEERYDAQCPGLHGAGYNHEALVFGCNDGILAIDLQDENYTATKFGSPESMLEGSRIGSVYAHHDVEALVTKAGSQLYATVIEEGAVSYQELVLDDGVTPLSQNFTPNGEFFWVVGDNAKIYLWDVEESWITSTSFSLSESEITSVFVAPSITSHQLYVLDVNNQKVIAVNYESGDIESTIELGFMPSGLAWMGLSEHDHDEEHDHEEGQDHDA